MDEQGLVTIQSQFSVAETIDGLAAEAERAGLLIFARIDHGQNAADLGLELRPTQVILIGHPRGGTPLMMDRQTAGIDLPLKALAWEDEEGRVWLSYNSAAWLSERHGLRDQSAAALSAIDAGMTMLASAATSRD